MSGQWPEWCQARGWGRHPRFSLDPVGEHDIVDAPRRLIDEERASWSSLLALGASAAEQFLEWAPESRATVLPAIRQQPDMSPRCTLEVKRELPARMGLLRTRLFTPI